MTTIAISNHDLASKIENEIRQSPHLSPLRDLNHEMIQNLNKAMSLRSEVCLDVGTSVHGFAMEAALTYRPRRFIGIDLGVERHWNALRVVAHTEDPDCSGELIQMDTQALMFQDEIFDILLSISSFEHFSEPAKALAEMYRVLRPGGTTLILFEPAWTASYGHHLHYLPCASPIPPWSHLLLSPQQMTLLLQQHMWPAEWSMTLPQAVSSIYYDPVINRIPLDSLRRLFAKSPFDIVWTSLIPDVADETRRSAVAYVASLFAIPADDLLTRGPSICLRKP